MTDVRTLQEQIEQLKSALGADRSFAGKLREAFGLEPDLATSLATLYSRPFVTRDTLYTILYSDKPEGECPAVKILDVNICKLRKKVKEAGIEIVTRWSEGWFLPQESKTIIRQTIAPTSDEKVEKYRSAFGLQPKQAKILAVLMDRPSINANSIKEFAATNSLARVQIYFIKRQLSVFGIALESRAGRWTIPEGSKISLITIINDISSARHKIRERRLAFLEGA